jgi:hypothetical protein
MIPSTPDRFWIWSVVGRITARIIPEGLLSQGLSIAEDFLWIKAEEK